MTTIQSPSHALGLMVINYYNAIAQQLPEVMLSTDGAKKVYPLILGLNAMLQKYSKEMYFVEIDKNGNTKELTYAQKRADLDARRAKLKFGVPSHLDLWTDWFGDYLTLLASCFDIIGLAPGTDFKFEDPDEQPYIPPEDTENTQ